MVGNRAKDSGHCNNWNFMNHANGTVERYSLHGIVRHLEDESDSERLRLINAN